MKMSQSGSCADLIPAWEQRNFVPVFKIGSHVHPGFNVDHVAKDDLELLIFLPPPPKCSNVRHPTGYSFCSIPKLTASSSSWPIPACSLDLQVVRGYMVVASDTLPMLPLHS